VARKGRARRFREARELKQRDDGFFSEGSGTLADVEDASEHEIEDGELDEEDEFAAQEDDPWADLRAEAE
jgi:hypothetical protein